MNQSRSMFMPRWMMLPCRKADVMRRHHSPSPTPRNVPVNGFNA